MSWNRDMGVLVTLAHHIAPELYTSTSRRPYVAMVDARRRWMLGYERVSTARGVAVPPAW